jgi:hypothetical protein
MPCAQHMHSKHHTAQLQASSTTPPLGTAGRLLHMLSHGAVCFGTYHVSEAFCVQQQPAPFGTKRRMLTPSPLSLVAAVCHMLVDPGPKGDALCAGSTAP